FNISEANTIGEELLAHPFISFFSWENILIVSYVLIGLLLCVRNVLGMCTLRKMVGRGKEVDYDKNKVIDIPSYPYSFTFFNKIILGNSNKRTALENELIIAHEKGHIVQKHWIDLSLIQVLCILQWFNPFIWLYSKSVKENLEYLADEVVLRKGIPPVVYQAVLINSTLNYSVFNLTSSFTSNKLKRITMMKKNSSKPIKKFSALLLIPAVGLFLWAFAEPEYKVVLSETSLPQQEEFDMQTDPDHSGSIKGDSTNAGAFWGYKNEKDSLKDEGIVVSSRKTKTGKTVFRTESDTAVKKKEDKPKAIFTPPVIRGEKKTEKTEKTEVIFSAPVVQGEAKTKDNEVSSLNLSEDESLKDALFILDGKEISREEVLKMNANTIKSVEVLKGKKATDLYGKKGENGVVQLSTKKNSETSVYVVKKEGNTYVGDANDGDKEDREKLKKDKILCVVDGKELAYETITELEKVIDAFEKDVLEITVVKDKEALKKYGEKGKNGAILVTTTN
ncbi:MAG: M56 family metallopeptidase, partial [Bacteroidales bacterium]|nr:M56 family metallopeptidase [Bacteroidales bacterium]